ncbi:DNA repair protein endonuclease SAE2/CtIP C-terminus-domain-containing protein [Achaetomium macrosporum]|uniref:DNA repair protein endonuclease SAE2/CtIP C-terminus-domain-containing protein n=1 Tax=Achaetomium macrosporum TaxID=79813 RepID=A0AAN7C6G5_9PEZI|nr:DNA repair protein endonuclease SAE2/CtIP C-terminus-domain-containing protein [Achaetomium macrosporum]
MDYWSRKGRPMLLAALETVCDTVEKELAADIQQQDGDHHASLLQEISQLKATAAKADQLERENRSLLREIESLREKQLPQHAATAQSPVRRPVVSGEQALPPIRPALAEISANINARALMTPDSSARDQVKPNFEKEYSKLARLYAALKERHEETKLLVKKYRDVRDGWIEYAQSLEVKIRKLERKLERNKGHDNELPPSSTTKPRPARTVAANAALLDDGGRPVEEETQDGSGRTPELPPIPPSMSVEPVAAIKEEPSSDEPVIISKRIISKRRHTDDGEIPTPPRRIKTEQSISSDPIITSEAPVFRPHESIDLDEEEQRIPTPRKERPLSIRAGWSLDHGIAEVAEDDFEPLHSPKPRGAVKNPKGQTPIQGRLHSLLHQGSPGKTSPLLPPTRPGPEKANQSKSDRLRDRPLAELRAEDFRVNPKFNSGYSYAFSEVIRNKGERAELAGCTDPNCCGRKFRAMAESELNAGGPGILSRVADTKMMEDYLGNEAYRLLGMTREERRELWLKAKTQLLADRYGRHRDRFARRPSPPGYWDPDFPSTQDIEQSKEEGERMERRLVEERWREAMRGGGRWLFRDE